MRRSSRGPAELLSFSHKWHIDFVRTVISFQRSPLRGAPLFGIILLKWKQNYDRWYDHATVFEGLLACR